MFLKIKNWWKQEKRTSKILSLSALLLVLFSLVLGGVIGTSYAAQTLPDKLTAGMGSLSSDDMFAVDLFPSLTGDDKILLTAPFVLLSTLCGRSCKSITMKGFFFLCAYRNV